MITIYNMDGVTHQPYKVPTEDIEDYADWQLVIFLWDRLARSIRPLILSILFIYLLWPKEISYDVF